MRLQEHRPLPDNESHLWIGRGGCLEMNFLSRAIWNRLGKEKENKKTPERTIEQWIIFQITRPGNTEGKLSLKEHNSFLIVTKIIELIYLLNHYWLNHNKIMLYIKNRQMNVISRSSTNTKTFRMWPFLDLKSLQLTLALYKSESYSRALVIYILNKH